MKSIKIYLITILFLLYIKSYGVIQPSKQGVDFIYDLLIKEKELQNLEELKASEMMINEIPFRPTQEQLIRKLGKPDSTKNADYDCGNFSSSWQGRDFPLYFYEKMNFIKDKEIFYVENIDFIESDWKVHYKGFVFSNKTTLQDMKKCFPKASELYLKRALIGEEIDIYMRFEHEEGIKVCWSFYQGKLISYQLLSDC